MNYVGLFLWSVIHFGFWTSTVFTMISLCSDWGINDLSWSLFCTFITVDSGMQSVAARLLGTGNGARHLAFLVAMVQAGLLLEAAI